MNLFYYKAEEISELKVSIGEEFKLESLRQAIVPPYLMLMPFIKGPEDIIVESQEALDEDGAHGCVYVLRAKSFTRGTLEIGFRDMMTCDVTHSNQIRVNAS